MDDTQPSRASDVASNATRKRRSSILKSQRPPRAPLSELEFNVATPTDTSKSRRVSFSRRTGVAEFVTNEATTTWKNFYEEHNKTLESSGNDSEAHPPRPSVGHLGKRIFDLEFPEVEAIDFATSDDGRGVETSMNIQFLDNTADNQNPTAPQVNFELSTFTDHQSKVFGDDLAISGLREITDKINVNFSTMQSLECDDLDEIQKDLDRQAGAQKFACPGPESGTNASGYVEVDLNITQMALKEYDESDMSITDTIHSPKVNVSKSIISGQNDKSVSQNWAADKENILLNPYVAPKESANFAINDESDKVLVFDGKRLTLQSENEPLSDYRKTLLPDRPPDTTPKRKTIVLNVDDDLPNLEEICQASMSHSKTSNFDKTTLENNDLSMTQPLLTRVETTNKRQTIVYADDAGDVSMTQALPTNLLFKQTEKRKMIVSDVNSDISVARAVQASLVDNLIEPLPAKQLSGTESKDLLVENIPSDETIVGDTDSSDKDDDILSSQDIPPNLIPAKKRESSNVSFPKAVSTNLILEKSASDKARLSLVTSLLEMPDIPAVYESRKEGRKTILFVEEAGNISITQSLPTNVIIPRKSTNSLLNNTKVLLNEIDTCLEPNMQQTKRRTILFDTDAAEISITEAISSNLILNDKSKADISHFSNANSKTEQEKQLHLEPDTENMGNTSKKSVPSTQLKGDAVICELAAKDNEERELVSTNPKKSQATIAYESDLKLNVSKSLPASRMSSSKLLLEDCEEVISSAIEIAPFASSNGKDAERLRTVVFDDEAADISMTRALPTNVILSAPKEASDKRKTILFEPELGDISMTQAIPTNILTNADAVSERRKTIVYENGADISMTQALPSNLILSATNEVRDKRKTIVFESDTGDISMTQAIPTNILTNAASDKRKTIIDESDADLSMTRALPTNVIISTTNEARDKRKTIVFESDLGEISMTQAIPTNILTNETNDIVNDTDANMSITRAVPINAILCTAKEPSDKRRTIVFEPEFGDVSMTQAIPANILENAASDNKKAIVIKMPQTADLPSDTSLYERPDCGLDSDELTSVASSATTITLSTGNRDPNEADVSMTESDDAQSRKDEALVSDAKIPFAIDKTLSADDDDRVTNLRNSIKPIPQDLLSLQKEISKSPFKKFTLESTRLQDDVMVYQTSTSAANPELGDHPPAISSSTSITGTDNEVKETYFAPPNYVASSEATDSSSNSPLAVIPSPAPRSMVAASTSDHLITPLTHNRKEQATNGIFGISQTTSVMSQIQNKVEQSILDHLLDMNDGSDDDDGLHDKSVMAQLSIQSRTEPESDASAPEIRRESMFYITRDSTDDLPTEKSDEELNAIKTLAENTLKTDEQPGLSVIQNLANTNTKTVQDQQPLRIEFEHVIESFGKKLNQFEKQYIPQNRHFEKVISPAASPDHKHKSYKEATKNSPKELFDMLSRFTEQEEKANPLEPVLSDEIKMKDVKKKQSPMQRRQSVVLSKEDLLKNISMAQAELQDMSEAENSPELPESPSPGVESPKKTVRMSTEVVKTLHFEDESTDVTNRFEAGLSPLKKTAFGESSYMREELRNASKPYVIPPYLKDVSEGIKELMNDLVKPMADVLPFESTGDGRLKKAASTCSTQIQANLFQSSQIDLDDSNADSAATLSGVQRKLKGIMKSSCNNSSSEEIDWTDDTALQPSSDRVSRDYSQPPRVIAFDPRNPLNNVLIAPIDFREAHKYEPSSSSEGSTSSNERSNHPIQVQFKDVDNSSYTANYNIPVVIPRYPTAVGVQKADNPVAETQSVIEVTNRTDSAVETIADTKEEEVNTLIAMKDNFMLLKESSSLTLVDDSMDVVEVDNDIEPDTGTSKNVTRESSRMDNSISRDDIVYTRELVDKVDLATLLHSEGERQTDNKMKRKKPDRHDGCTLSSLDLTPKPASKLVKHSIRTRDSGQLSVSYLMAEDSEENLPNEAVDSSNVKSKAHPIRSSNADAIAHRAITKKTRHKLGTRNRKPGTTITVQRVSTEYDNARAHDDHEPPVEATDVSHASSSVSSRTSKAREEKRDDQSLSSVCVNETKPADWLPGLLNQLSSRSLVEQCDSDMDVVSKIHKLPFIANGECEWESLSGEQWSFRLLLRRIQLTVRLAPRPAAAAAWSRVHSATPVLGVSLHLHTHNMKNSLAILCVHFAAEAMRFVTARGVGAAGDVAALLRRCAGAARAALRWGRAMHHAWTQLAFTLTTDGYLTLKVANIPLRSVWEVSMRLSLVVEDSRGVPWPRACELRATPALGAAPPVPPRDLAALTARVRHDWGHVPKTIWKVFKYLRYKAQDDEYFLGK